MNDVDRLNHRRLCRLAAGLGIRLFATVYQDRSLRIVQFEFTIKHRHRGLPIRSDSCNKLGPSYRSIGRRSFQLHLASRFTTEKVSGTLLQAESRLRAPFSRRQDLGLRQLVHPKDAQIGEAHGGPAIFPGPQPFPDVERLARGSRHPRRVSLCDINYVFYGKKYRRRRAVRSLRSDGPKKEAAR